MIVTTERIRITREVVRAAHAVGISVGAELGRLGEVEEHIQVADKDVHLTAEYAAFIAHEDDVLLSAGTLETVRKALA